MRWWPKAGRTGKLTMSCRLLFSHPTGNAFAKAALSCLYEAGMLAEFHTSVASYPGNIWDALSRNRWGKDFQRRKFDHCLQPLTVQHPFRELGRLMASRFKCGGLTRHETGPFCLDAIYRRQDQMTARRLRRRPKLFTGVYVFEDGALDTLAVAKQQGLLRLYDLPIGYWRSARKLLHGELERHPEWRNTLTNFNDSTEKLDRKDAELASASRVIVASSFTASTLKDYPAQSVPHVVVPYGFPSIGPEPTRFGRRAGRDKSLRLLFVGSLSQRKGIADLFAAMNILGQAVSLTVIGNRVTDDCPALDRELAKHRYIQSLPHEQILEEMRGHDVLVFPSLFEGFGLVITEAMSQGTPVITTERTAGPDLITHGHNGWLIQAGSTDALVQQLEQLIANPEHVLAVAVNARQSAAARPWSSYGGELVAAIMSPL
jgi:glycosyltransferase involved in cell wall biosynthesis